MAVIPSTAWAMAYGTGMLALYGVATGVEWSIEPTAAYLGSLVYLSVFGSVIAFVVYFGIARTRGYALASYISALTPPIAMLVSVLFSVVPLLEIRNVKPSMLLRQDLASVPRFDWVKWIVGIRVLDSGRLSQSPLPLT